MSPSLHASWAFGVVLLLYTTGVWLPSCSAATAASPSSQQTSSFSSYNNRVVQVVIGVDGGTESIRACCFDALTGQVIGAPCAVPYPTFHPQPGWAEQDPNDWYDNLGSAVRGAVDSIPATSPSTTITAFEICGMCVDTTCCSVVALNDEYTPLRRSLLWMDARSAAQTEEIMATCRGDPALNVNCGGEGPLSAEWMTPKALWIRQNEPDTWDKATTICEYQDYINYKLTGILCASSCNAVSRWHWDGDECIRPSSLSGGGDDADDADIYPGRPMSLYRALGIPELADKLPRLCLPMGALVGHLTKDAAKHLNLPEGLPVLQGGPDAFVGMVGLGCIAPGQLCLITGSSHLHCVVSAKPTSAPGTWGAYKGAPLPGINFAEGGQSSTGSILRWARHLFGASDVAYRQLDDEASAIPPGCDGLVALETFQGSRTPVTDPLARGALLGLTLSHTRAHIWRAWMEAVCFGTRACIEALAQAGHNCDEIIMAGGATNSDLWLQMHADVTGKPVIVCENSDAPLLGCAILASIGLGIHPSAEEAVRSMVRAVRRIHPSRELADTYSNLYNKIYSRVGSATGPMAHAIAELRGGGMKASVERRNTEKDDTTCHPSPTKGAKQQQSPTISPSLLACDWADMKGEVHRCIEAGTKRLHVDIFDGVYLDSPHAFSFGPQMVAAIRRCSDKAILDLHMCVDRPARYVAPMAKAGANTFIFQWEAMEGRAAQAESNSSGQLAAAIQLAKQVVESGMDCGVSINPATHVEEIFPLLQAGLISVVDVLAVEPGFGGQVFQNIALTKIERLRQFREQQETRLTMASLLLMLDGGINEKTVSSVDADILVAGTFLFQHPVALSQGVNELLALYATSSNPRLNTKTSKKE
jgi:ribulose-phosphate 3-epimerase